VAANTVAHTFAGWPGVPRRAGAPPGTRRWGSGGRHAGAAGPAGNEGAGPVNRRGNGLSADAYAPLVDLAPHLADAMLAALGEAGVAAYAAPPSGTAPGEPVPPGPGPAGEPGAGDPADRPDGDAEGEPAAE